MVVSMTEIPSDFFMELCRRSLQEEKLRKKNKSCNTGVGDVGVQNSNNNQTTSTHSTHFTNKSVYKGIDFHLRVESVPNTSLKKVVDWYITFEGTVIYILSETYDCKDTLLDRLKKAIEFKYPFIKMEVGYNVCENCLPSGRVCISTIPNVTQPLRLCIGYKINLPYNLDVNWEYFLGIDYTQMCEEFNKAIDRMLKHCNYTEVR